MAGEGPRASGRASRTPKADTAALHEKRELSGIQLLRCLATDPLFWVTDGKVPCRGLGTGKTPPWPGLPCPAVTRWRRLTVVQEELGDGQQRPHASRVPAQPGMQGPQAGEGAVQERGVLPAEHVQHQHGLHQALGRHRGCSDGAARAQPPARCPPAGTHGFLQLRVRLPQGSWGKEEGHLVSASPSEPPHEKARVFWTLEERR